MKLHVSLIYHDKNKKGQPKLSFLNQTDG